jgi:hypothetical protein
VFNTPSKYTNEMAMIDMSTTELTRIKDNTTNKAKAGLPISNGEWDRLRVLNNILNSREIK